MMLVWGKSWSFRIAVIFVTALVVRVMWVLWVQREGFVLNDALIYQTYADALVHGRPIESLGGGPTAQWPPGYSVLLAGLYLITGVKPQVGELFNAFIGAATVIPLMVLVSGMTNRRAATIAGAILAVMPGTIMWADVLVTETLYTFMLVVFFLLLSYAKPTWKWMIGLGAMIGLGGLVRGEALTWGLLPIVLLWPMVTRRELVAKVALVGLAAIVTLSPWTIRNAVVMDAFVPVATNASHTLWVGHNPGATGGQVYPPPEYFDRFPPDAPEHELESSAALRNDAVEYMVSHPWRELQLIPLKLISLNRGDSYALDWVNHVPPTEAPPLSPLAVGRIATIADSAYHGLFALTVVGALWLRRRWWAEPVPRCIAAIGIFSLFLYGFVYYGNYRYRLPLEPLMIVVVAVFLDQIWRRRDARKTVGEYRDMHVNRDRLPTGYGGAESF